jgi:hypothetical protein
VGSRVIVLGRVQLLLGRVDGRVQGVRVQGVRVQKIPCPSRFPAKGRGLECARILCNCGRT